MRRRLFTILIVAAALLSASALTSCRNGGSSDNYLVVVSLDAFRWDFPYIHGTPFLDSLGAAGVSAVMEPSYPASTFPNHYALATGLVPDHNGIVNNSFWDPEDSVRYRMGDSTTRFNPKYYLGEPIWVTSDRQGVKSGVIYWVSSDIEGHFPTYYHPWNDDPYHLNFEQRCDEVIRYLSLPEEERPRLVMAYFDEPDWTGHADGPLGAETGNTVHRMDSLMSSLYHRIKALPIADKVNFVVLSDHGMTEISDERVILIPEVIDTSLCERIIPGNPTSVFAKPGMADSLFNTVRLDPNMNVWRHGQVPAPLNYGTSDRIGDVILAANCGWNLVSSARKGGKKGNHGYSPLDSDMQVIFRAEGPAFRKGFNARPYGDVTPCAFKNVDIYPMIAEILGFEPRPTDGDLGRIRKILK